MIRSNLGISTTDQADPEDIEPTGVDMHQTLGAAVRTMITLLAFAMFLPVITGFDNAAAQSGTVIAPEAAPAAQPPQPTAPEGAGTPGKDPPCPAHRPCEQLPYECDDGHRRLPG